MNVIDYIIGKKLSRMDIPFDALIVAAFERADHSNLVKLKAMFPLIDVEIKKREASEDGLLKDEEDFDKNQISRIVQGYLS